MYMACKNIQNIHGIYHTVYNKRSSRWYFSSHVRKNMNLYKTNVSSSDKYLTLDIF